MILTAYDAAGELYRKIPPKALVVMGYLDGPGTWPAAAWSAFPTSRKLRISTLANPLADIFDNEAGSASLTAQRGAVIYRAAAYLPSVVYCSKDRWPEAAAAMQGLPVAWWVAAWLSGGPPPTRPMTGAAGWQWLSTDDYDQSVIDTDIWPGFGSAWRPEGS